MKIKLMLLTGFLIVIGLFSISSISANVSLSDAFTRYLDPIVPENINNSPDNMATGDFNGDGRSDVYFHWRSTGTNRMYYSNGNGTFTTYFDPIEVGDIDDEPNNLRVGDFNGDGKDDVYFHWKSLGRNRLYFSNGNGTFTGYRDPIGAEDIDENPENMRVGDFNGDGRDDVYFHWKTLGRNRLYYSNLVLPPQTPTPTPFPTLRPPTATPIPQPGECRVPFFSQVDKKWKDHPLRTGTVYNCDASCNTIGRCGCTLTSAAMVFKYFGATTTRNGTTMRPDNLSDCMGKAACPFIWNGDKYHSGEWCTNGKAKFVDIYTFSWSRLDRELNQNHRPVILEMRKGTNTHWVVVLSGSGSNPSNYLIHDPALSGGANIRLSTRSSWAFKRIAVYRGNANCTAVSWEFEGFDPASLQPAPLQTTDNVTISQLTTPTFANQITAPESVISGTVWIYTMTELTMTVELTASSSIANVSQMVIWTDTISNTNWQPFSPYVWVPLSEFVYVKYQDTLGNVTDVYSATTDFIGPLDPVAIYEVYLPVVIRE